MAYIGKQPVVGNFVKLDAITTSATTTFNLTNGGVAYYPQSANNCIVSLNGVIQSPTSAYTISGSTIVFSDALTSSDTIDFILVLGDVLSIGTPSDNTVSLTKLTATGTKDATTFLRGDNTFATVTADGTADWDTSVKTTGFTATANKGYFCNTTSSAFTVTLPATPSAGDEIIILDYAGTFDTNALTISPNGNKIEGGTANLQLTGEREGARLVYIDSTQGWIAVSGINEGTNALSPIFSGSVEYLVVAGGGGGGAHGGGGGGAGGFRTGTLTGLTTATNYTVTVGGGGGSTANAPGSQGSSSVFSTITSAGGGGGGGGIPSSAAGSGGSGGGGAGDASNPGAAGNTPSTTPSQGNNGGSGSMPIYSGGGGGGASAVGSNGSSGGGNGGNGTASSITGSSVTYAGGGGGSCQNATPQGTGGTGGGGAGVQQVPANPGTANRGGGGGGNHQGSPNAAGLGGSGIVVLKYQSSFTLTNPGGGLTFSTSTSGSDKITSFTAGTGNVQWN